MALKTQANIWLVVLLLLGILAIALYVRPPAAVPPAPVKYEGEFRAIGLPMEVTGTWLTGSEQVVTQYGQYNFTTKKALSVVGSVYPLAFRFDIDDAFEKVRIDITKLSSEIDLVEACILPDEKEMTLDCKNALYKAEIDTVRGTAEFKIDNLSDKQYDKYVMLLSTKVTDPAVNSTYVTADSDLFKLVFDGKSDGDVKDFTVMIINGGY
ncbi:MAG: hypothetical protein ACP5G1_01585 [Nanopusillaceae archaeon]